MSMHRTVGVYHPRSRRAQVTDALASARAFVTGLLFEGVRRALGLCLVVLAFAIVVALLTYDPADPSFNVATWRLPQNWMGASGEYTDDLLFEMIGWAEFAVDMALT